MSDKKQLIRKIVQGSGAAAIGVLAGCSGADVPGEAAGSAISPLISRAEGAADALVGTYDGQTGSAWLIAHVVNEAKALAEGEGIMDPQVVVFIKERGMTVAADDGSAELPADLAPGTELRACVVEPSTALRWTIADFHIGEAGDLDGTLEEFVPTALAEESDVPGGTNMNCQPP
jgi:hypothetical protein